MREILFRGKTTVKDAGIEEFNNKWVYGNVIHAGNKVYIHPKGNGADVENEIGKLIIMHEAVPETVGQYTGLTDKNGRKIFEGDIMSGKFDSLFPNDVTVVSVGWYINGWHTFQNKRLPSPLEPSDGEIFEVIGNIYDNPELLEEAAE